MRCACIDIGSNTTRLLVAEVVGPLLTPLVQRRAFTQLGRACGAGGELPPTAVAGLADVVAPLVREARAHDVTALRVVATAAVRRAANGADACRALAAHTGVAVEVLSEHDEARLAFAGATTELPVIPHGEPLAVVDVGGGSSQVIVGTRATGATWSMSLPLGSGDLAAAHLSADPPTVAQLDAVRAAVATSLAGLALPPVGRALAVGGSATSLRRLGGPLLDPAALEAALGLLTEAPAAAVAARHEIAAERVRLLPAGLVVLAALGALLGPLEVAQGGLREGVVRELAGA